jgi:hypothetical protein
MGALAFGMLVLFLHEHEMMCDSEGPPLVFTVNASKHSELHAVFSYGHSAKGPASYFLHTEGVKAETLEQALAGFTAEDRYHRPWVESSPCSFPLGQEMIIELRQWKKERRINAFKIVSMIAPVLSPLFSFESHRWNGRAARSGLGQQYKLHAGQANDAFTRHFGDSSHARGLFIYPSGGFAGWHSNCFDETGWRVYIVGTHGDTGPSWFAYRDWRTGKIHRLVDTPGMVHIFKLQPCPRLYHTIYSDGQVRWSMGAAISETLAQELQSVAEVLPTVVPDAATMLHERQSL